VRSGKSGGLICSEKLGGNDETFWRRARNDRVQIPRWTGALMSGVLSGRSALVTGGSRGLGLAMAEALAAAGASVMLGDILEAEGKDAAKALGAKGKAAFTKLDVTSEESWEASIDATVKNLGGLDILVNNAGIEITGLATEVRAADLLKMCSVNIVGTGLGIKYGLRAMRPGGAAGKGGSIINISSVAATIAFPGIMGYSGTKSAVDRMTRVAAVEAGKLGAGVRVNCIYPGLVPTAMGVQLAQNVVEVGLFPSVDEAIGAVVQQTPLGRLGDPTDMADAVVFLASDASRFITGIGLPVDGGMGT
jgi:3alpha(or 20beta)-hydroxysteroid dehydrogenase